MDPEIIKTATELAKATGTAAGLSIPFTGIVKRMLGPAANELAEMWRDQVRLYRYERQLKCVQKAERMAGEAGFIPKAVPPKILFPLLEGASFEDDESLHDMWAALLANAASPDAVRVRSIFVGILRQLSKDEAQLLSWAFDRMLSDRSSRLASDPYPAMFPRTDVLAAYDALCGTTPGGSASSLNRQTCLDSLEAAQLLPRRFDVINIGGEQYYSLSALGYQFVEACRPPKPKENV